MSYFDVYRDFGYLIAEAINIDKAKRTVVKLKNSKKNNREEAGSAAGDAMAAAALEQATGIPSVTKISKMRAANKATGRADKRKDTINTIKDAIKAAKENPEDYPSLR